MNPSKSSVPLSTDVHHVLEEVFGSTLERVAPLAGGMSGATVLDARADGRRYVVRHIDGSGPLDAPERQLRCLSLAAARGVAPRLHHADSERGVFVMEHIEGPPIGPLLAADGLALRDLALRFRTLHEGPAFPPFTTPADITLAIIDKLAATEGVSTLAQMATEVRAALAPHVVLAPCHNDPNTANLLFDGSRTWLIDWETAGQGDPFQDLASLGVFALHRPPARAAFLRAYFGREPTRLETARLDVARVGSLAYFASTFFYGAHLRGGIGHDSEREPIPELATVLTQWRELGPRAFRDPAWMGKVLRDEALRNYEGDAYREARRRLASG